MEFIATFTIRENAGAADAEALLDGFLATCREASPVVAHDLAAGTLDVTFAVDAAGIDEALARGRTMFTTGVETAGFDPPPLVGVQIEPAAATTDLPQRA